MPVRPSLQLRQRPQAMLKGTETMSPGLRNWTSRPHSRITPGDLVAEDQTLLSGGAAADHMLVAAADIGGDYFKNHTVVAFALTQGKLGKGDRFHRDLARAFVDDTAVLVAAHGQYSSCCGCNDAPNHTAAIAAACSARRKGIRPWRRPATAAGFLP